MQIDFHFHHREQSTTTPGRDPISRWLALATTAASPLPLPSPRHYPPQVQHRRESINGPGSRLTATDARPPAQLEPVAGDPDSSNSPGARFGARARARHRLRGRSSLRAPRY